MRMASAVWLRICSSYRCNNKLTELLINKEHHVIWSGRDAVRVPLAPKVRQRPSWIIGTITNLFTWSKEHRCWSSASNWIDRWKYELHRGVNKVDAFVEASQLTALGRIMTRSTCVKAIQNRLWLQHWKVKTSLLWNCESSRILLLDCLVVEPPYSKT